MSVCGNSFYNLATSLIVLQFLRKTGPPIQKYPIITLTKDLRRCWVYYHGESNWQALYSSAMNLSDASVTHATDWSDIWRGIRKADMAHEKNDYLNCFLLHWLLRQPCVSVLELSDPNFPCIDAVFPNLKRNCLWQCYTSYSQPGRVMVVNVAGCVVTCT